VGGSGPDKVPAGKNGFEMSMSAIFREANGSRRWTLSKVPGFFGLDMLLEGGCGSSKIPELVLNSKTDQRHCTSPKLYSDILSKLA
jgi:hypothetical protein